MQTLIIIPTYNEKGNLKPLTEEILALLPETDILIASQSKHLG